MPGISPPQLKLPSGLHRRVRAERGRGARLVGVAVDHEIGLRASPPTGIAPTSGCSARRRARSSARRRRDQQHRVVGRDRAARDRPARPDRRAAIRPSLEKAEMTSASPLVERAVHEGRLEGPLRLKAGRRRAAAPPIRAGAGTRDRRRASSSARRGARSAMRRDAQRRPRGRGAWPAHRRSRSRAARARVTPSRFAQLGGQLAQHVGAGRDVACGPAHWSTASRNSRHRRRCRRRRARGRRPPSRGRPCAAPASPASRSRCGDQLGEDELLGEVLGADDVGRRPSQRRRASGATAEPAPTPAADAGDDQRQRERAARARLDQAEQLVGHERQHRRGGAAEQHADPVLGLQPGEDVVAEARLRRPASPASRRRSSRPPRCARRP